MWGPSDRDMSKHLTHVITWAMDAAKFNQQEANRLAAGVIGADPRYKSYDPNAVVQRGMEARQYGRALELTDPELRKGGEVRPPARSHYPGSV
jgi:hypothetical protein